MILEDLTREERLLVNLAKASCAGKQSAALDQWFDNLPAAGWLIELCRVHIRLNTGISFQHHEFAAALQLHRGRAYRVTLVRDDAVSSCVAVLAKRVISELEAPTIVSDMQQLPEYATLQHELYMGVPGAGLIERKRGRRPSESSATASPESIELEKMRVSAHLTLKDWARRIGTSENTYRAKLLYGDIPQEWIDAGAAVINGIHEELILSAARRKLAAITDTDLTEAFASVWRSYLRRTGAAVYLAQEAAAAAPADSQEEQHRRDDEELLTFVPSSEEGSIEIEIADEASELTPEDIAAMARFKATHPNFMKPKDQDKKGQDQP